MDEWKIPSCSNSASVSKMNKLSHSFFHFCLFRNKDKFKVQEKASLSSFIKMVCALFCAKGPYFFRQNIQFTAYNNDVKFAHNLFCSLDISQKYIGILLPKLFWPTVRKNCSIDRGKLLKFKAEGREFAKFLRSLE